MTISLPEFDRAFARVLARNQINSENLLGLDALRILLCRFEFKTVLDVGAGPCVHAAILKELGKRVVTIDWQTNSPTRVSNVASPDIVGDYVATRFPEPFDVVWCCHALEHQRNTGLFLEKLLNDVKDGGILALTVPPAKHALVGGHLSIWNLGLLFYNLVMAGNDCSSAVAGKYGYNLSALVRRKQITDFPQSLVSGRGDLEKLAGYFPFAVQQDIDGDFQGINWPALE